MSEQKLKKIKELCEQFSTRKCWSDNDNFMIDDYAAGNMDDAYYGGYDDGETILARDILMILEKKDED